MFKKLNLQFILSYFGLLPFFFIILNKYFFFQINEEIILNFSIYYALFIFIFIGSINWNLENKPNNIIIFYGFLPSLISVVLLILNLYEFNPKILIFSLVCLFIIQLISDYMLLYSKVKNKHSFYYLRLPLTLIIISLLYIIIN